MGKMKIKKPKTQKNSIPAPLNVTNFTMEQISRQTGVRIESLKAYLNAREQEIKEQLIKESQEKLWKAEDYIAVANILISVIAIKKTWGFKKANQNFIDKITEAERYVEEIGVEAAYKEIKEEMGLQIEFDSFDINKEFGFGEYEEKAIDVIREQVEQGVIYVEKNGKFWKIANKTNNPFKIIPIKPKRMEVRLKSGYLGIVVWKDGKQYLMLAHRAMWELFVDKIPDKMDINHKNGNKQDNRLENLEIVTRSQNLRHAINTGLKIYSNYHKQYSEKAKQLRNTGMSFSKIGETLGISQITAFKAVKFKS